MLFPLVLGQGIKGIWKETAVPIHAVRCYCARVGLCMITVISCKELDAVGYEFGKSYP